MDASIYDADYFLHGKESGKSLYENYHWMPELTIPMVIAIAKHLGIRKDHDAILDFGCARGYTVKAFRELGYESYGIDLSEWAILNADEKTRQWLSCSDKLPPGMDWIIAKDVLEHVEFVADKITELLEAARVGVFAVVPLSPHDGHEYVVPDYERDVTHIHRLTIGTWVRLFARPGWSVECSYSVAGVKENYAKYALGNGFITARRK